MYSRRSSFHCSASSSDTTPRTTATPRFLNSLLNVSGALSISLKSISGMTLEPSSTMSGISSRSSWSKRSQDSRTSVSRPLISRPFKSAYSGIKGLNSWPERDANASDMSPARFCACVAAVRSCVANRLVGDRTARSVESMADETGVSSRCALDASGWPSLFKHLAHYIPSTASLFLETRCGSDRELKLW